MSALRALWQDAVGALREKRASPPSSFLEGAAASKGATEPLGVLSADQVAGAALPEKDQEEKSYEQYLKNSKRLTLMHKQMLSDRGGRNLPAAPSSFVQEGAPDSFADIDAKLKALEEKTKAELAKLQSDTAAPSSFVQEGAPDSFADIDAKLKALEEKTKAELAKLQSDTAAPSSFVQTATDSG